MSDFDVIVLGAGPVGENVADYAHRGGLSVAIVETELVGGECSYWACVPSKALLRPVQAWSAADRVDGSKQSLGSPVNAAAALARRDRFVSDYDDSAQAEWLTETGVMLIRGEGRLSGERRITVSHAGDERILEASLAVVVCTGSTPVIPAGLAGANPWTSREATGMTTVPRRAVVIGGGPVACEMATALAGLGAEHVTMLVRGDRLLQRSEPFAGELVAAGLRGRGVTVRFGTEAVGAVRNDQQSGSGSAEITVRLAEDETLTADVLLVATGRRPRTDDLNLESVGLRSGDALDTDEGGAVRGISGSWLFAAGDVTGAAPLTHQGKYQARLVGSRLACQKRGRPPDLASWGEHAATADAVAVPQVIFTDPQVATVGLTSRRAREKGLRISTFDCDLSAIAGASLHADGYSGRAAIVVDRDREVIVGMTVVGPDIAEILHAATIAIVGEVPLDRLWHAVPAFPTISEVWLRLLEQWHGSGTD